MIEDSHKLQFSNSFQSFDSSNTTVLVLLNHATFHQFTNIRSVFSYTKISGKKFTVDCICGLPVTSPSEMLSVRPNEKFASPWITKNISRIHPQSLIIT